VERWRRNTTPPSACGRGDAAASGAGPRKAAGLVVGVIRTRTAASRDAQTTTCRRASAGLVPRGGGGKPDRASSARGRARGVTPGEAVYVGDLTGAWLPARPGWPISSTRAATGAADLPLARRRPRGTPASGRWGAGEGLVNRRPS
jgi:hypothetical protein